MQQDAFQHNALQVGIPGAAGPTVYNDTQTESVTATDASAGKALQPATQAETATATDSSAGKATQVATQAESATATDSSTAIAIWKNTQTETATATDAYAGAGAQVATQAETTTATHSSAGAGIQAATQAETTTATDSDAGAGLQAVIHTESVSVLDGFVSTAIWSSTQVETTTPHDDYARSNVPGGIVYDDTQTESITATDFFNSNAVWSASLLETATASDNYFTPASGSDFLASLIATDAYQAAQVMGEAQVETVTATDDDKQGIGHSQEETTILTMALALLQAMGSTRTETATLDFRLNRSAVLPLDWLESVTLSDAYNALKMTVVGGENIFVSTLTDSYEAKAVQGESQSESVTASFDLEFGIPASSQLELATATDTVLANQGYACSMAEAVTVSDSYDAILQRPLFVADSLTCTATDAYEAILVSANEQVESTTPSLDFAYAPLPSTGFNFHVWNGVGWV